MEESLEEKEIRSWKRKLILAWVLALPIMLVMYSGMIFGTPLVPMMYMPLVSLLLGFPVIFIIGWLSLIHI